MASGQERRICPYTGKITYPNPQRAWAAAQRLNRKSTRDGHSTVHKCDDCHLWHVTGQNTRERKAKWQRTLPRPARRKRRPPTTPD